MLFIEPKVRPASSHGMAYPGPARKGFERQERCRVSDGGVSDTPRTDALISSFFSRGKKVSFVQRQLELYQLARRLEQELRELTCTVRLTEGDHESPSYPFRPTGTRMQR